jgi:hypothetical protein
MALYSVEVLIEVEAVSAEDAAALAVLDARTTPVPMTVSVYSDDATTGRCCQAVIVDVLALECGSA